MAQTSRLLIIFGVLAALSAYLSGPVVRRVKVLGILRTPRNTPYHDFVHIEDTVQCEDLHYLPLTNELITACENQNIKAEWFPPLGHVDDPNVTFKGDLHVIDATTMKSRRLVFKNFKGGLVTHGIDVIPDPNTLNAYFIFAINHLPNPEYRAGATDVPQARSQVELFHYVSGSSTAEHIRSIRHPLITTPNDIYATSPTSFYVTNDHYYRTGGLRQVEDFITSSTWSNVIYASFPSSGSPESGVVASVALTGIQNNNGMGHVRNPQWDNQEEILITSAAGGVLYRVAPTNQGSKSDHNLTILEDIPLDSTLDNPTYFADPYPTHHHNASGYVVGGLGKATDFLANIKNPDFKDPFMVWHVTPSAHFTGPSDRWNKKLLFENDGSLVRAATTAVLTPIEPVAGSSEKEAWLWIASVLGERIVAVKVTL